MAETYEDPSVLYTAPLVERWRMMHRAGVQAKQQFLSIHDQCQAFYFDTSRFLWEDEHRNRFLGPDAPIPKFQVTINKAFEYISIFVPMLCWQNPSRKVSSEGQFDLQGVAELLAPYAEQDPQLADLMQGQAQDSARDELRNKVWEKYLKKTAYLLPDGGLRGHAKLGIQDYLLAGRGVIMPRTYGPPNSDRSLTGLFHVPVRRLTIDPDSCRAHGEDAAWMSITHWDYYWDVEARFRLRRGSLKGKGQLGSVSAEAGRYDRNSQYSTASKDIICWHEIWTRCGVGGRFSGEQPLPLADDFEELIGDHAYLAISDCCSYPLNLPGSLLFGEDTTDDDITRALSWPVEYFEDNRWPFEFLDYFPQNGSPWPVAPLAVCIGELVCLQILLSIYLGNAHANSFQIIGYLAEEAKQIEDQIKRGVNPIMLQFKADFNKAVNELIQFINKPNQNTDLLQAMEFLMEAIERKTGLSELLYGRNPGGTQSRSAADIAAKKEQVNIRPEFMGSEVADWLSRASDLERICAFDQIGPDDVEPALGQLGAYLWENLILADDRETAVRGLRCRVEASDLKRPNQERDTENLQSMLNFLVPALQEYATQTHNWEPMNGFLKAIGKAAEIDVSGFLLPPPSPDEGQIALERAEQEANIAATEAKAAEGQASAQAQMVEAEANAAAAQAGAEGEMAMTGAKIGIEQQTAGQKMALTSAQAQQKMAQSDDLHQQKLAMNEVLFRQKVQAQKAMAAAAAKAKAKQGANSGSSAGA